MSQFYGPTGAGDPSATATRGRIDLERLLGAHATLACLLSALERLGASNALMVAAYELRAVDLGTLELLLELESSLGLGGHDPTAPGASGDWDAGWVLAAVCAHARDHPGLGLLELLAWVGKHTRDPARKALLRRTYARVRDDGGRGRGGHDP